LKFFSWNYPLNEETLRALGLYFLPRFPALEKLELTDHCELQFSAEMANHEDSEENDDADDVPLPQGNEKEIMDFLERENYWGICKKLKSIHVCHHRELERDAIYVGYRK